MIVRKNRRIRRNGMVDVETETDRYIDRQAEREPEKQTEGESERGCVVLF